MKVSVSLPDDDVAFLDEYAADHGLGSRSAALQAAVGLLRTRGLASDYAAAWDAWDADPDAALWDAVTDAG
ncbi:MAG: ribbon-helix-helix domain-containing protein [Candidatus Nanopelagicales bacterium]